MVLSGAPDMIPLYGRNPITPLFERGMAENKEESTPHGSGCGSVETCRNAPPFAGRETVR